MLSLMILDKIKIKFFSVPRASNLSHVLYCRYIYVQRCSVFTLTPESAISR